MAWYPVIVAGASMGAKMNDNTYGMMIPGMGAAADVVSDPAGGYRYESDLSVNGNAGNMLLSSRGLSLELDGEGGGGYLTVWCLVDILASGNPTSDAIPCYWSQYTVDSQRWRLVWRSADRKLELIEHITGDVSMGVSASAVDLTVLTRLKFKMYVTLSGATEYRHIDIYDSTDTLILSGTTPGKAEEDDIYRWYLGEALAAGVNRGITFHFKNVSAYQQAADPGWPKIATLLVDADGTYNDFGPYPAETNRHDDVDEIPPNDSTDFVYATTTNQWQSFHFQSCTEGGIPSGATIICPVVYYRHRATEGGKFTAYWGVKLGAAEQLSFQVFDPGNVFTQAPQGLLSTIRLLDPAGNPWTRVNLDALEVGFRTYTSDHTEQWHITQICVAVLYQEGIGPPPHAWAQVF